MIDPHRNRSAAFAFAVVLIVVAPIALAADDGADDLDLLASWMTGTFSSAAQAAEDPDFPDTSLHVSRIWSDRSDGRWLYVEQAMSERQDLPYRQRVYRVVELVPGLFECQVFALPNPAAVVGAWAADDSLADLGPGDLDERDGCEILLRRRGDSFIGSTLASLCTSTLRGAAYATSEVIVTPDGIVSWDRGFAADGSQTWGMVTGGSVFDRIVPDDAGSESESESESAPGSETEAGSGSGSGSDGMIDEQRDVKPEAQSLPE
jgi:hypothetical protein